MELKYFEEEKFELEANELELAVINALLISPEHWPDVFGWLTAKMFSDPGAAFAYQTMVALYEQGEKPDYLTTEREMRKTNPVLFEQVNGLDMLGQSLYTICHGANVKAYAASIKENWLFRQAEATFRTLREQAKAHKGDPQALLNEADRLLMEIREQIVDSHTAKPLTHWLNEALEIHRKRVSEPADSHSVFTGISELDAIFLGLQNGELYVEGGRPGDGKTAVALHIAVEAAQNGKRVLYHCMEMSNLQMVNRIWAGYAGIHPENLRLSNLTGEELEQMAQLPQQVNMGNLFIDYTPSNSRQKMRAQALLLGKQQKVDLIVVDYLHLMEEQAQKGDTQEAIVGRNAKAMKNLAREADCPVLLLSQMNRNNEHRTEKNYMPRMSDLRDSGVIEQVADAVFFVHRPERHGILEDPKTGENYENKVFLVVCKNRNGAIGIARCLKNESFTRIYNEINN